MVHIKGSFYLFAAAAAVGAEAVVSLDPAMATIGIPLAGIAACFFGALFGMLYMPIPKEGEVRQVPVYLALPTSWGVGVFSAAGVGYVFSITNSAALSFIGLVISACPVPIIRSASGWITKKFGGE